MLKNWFKVMLLFVGNELVLRLTKPNEYGVKIFTVIDLLCKLMKKGFKGYKITEILRFLMLQIP